MSCICAYVCVCVILYIDVTVAVCVIQLSSPSKFVCGQLSHHR